MNVYLVKTGSILPLGKQGEKLVRQIQFDLSRWISNFGPGTVQLLHKRSGDEAPYPVAVEQEGNLAVWTVTSADTAAAGTGRAELQYYVGDALAKSETWMTKVFPALGDASEMPPEAQQGWVDQVLAQVAKITGMTAQAVELPAGSAPTADYADGVLTIGIPLGGDVSEAQIAQAVAEYLSNNPIAETDPTVPDWAKEEKKPSYTADEVGADPSGTAASQVSVHNTGTDTHSDIRLLIQGLTERINALADSDDTTLDQLSEVVAYIKSNRSLIEDITTSKVSVANIIDNLTTNVTNKPLSAAQGVALKALIDAITVPDKLPNPNALTFTGAVSGSYDGSAPLEVAIPSGGGGLTVTNTAAVGQTIKVSAVDENGQPTEWEAVDMPSGGGSISLPLLYDLTTSEEVGWIDTGDNAFLAKSLLFVELISIATTTNQSDGSGSASMYPLKSGIVQAPWNNQVVAVKTSALMAKNYTKVFRAFCFRGDEGHWTSITSIRNTSNEASVTPGMVSARIDGVTDQPMRGLIIGNAAASSTNVLGVGSRLRVWGV